MAKAASNIGEIGKFSEAEEYPSTGSQAETTLKTSAGVQKPEF